MKKKIKGLFVCIVLMFTIVPAVESLRNSTINPTVLGTSVSSMAVNWTEIQKLLPSDGTASDYFGYSVSLSGDTALIGADGDDDNGVDSGSAYVFTRTGTTWTQQAKLLAPDGVAHDLFGSSVSLCNNTALVGAVDDEDNGVDSGSVYVFIRTSTTWTLQAKLLAPDGAAGDYFGYSVSLSGDTALIGADGGDDNGVDSGSAYVFTRTSTTWTQQQKILAPDGTMNDFFGGSVSLSGDTALIGAFCDDDNGVQSGSAYVFIRIGTTWTQQAKLLASDGAAIDYFGWSVSLSGDTALIGADGDDDNGVNSGSAYVFIRIGTTWTQQAKLLASDGAVYDSFGWSVSLSSDTALIGAPFDDDNGNDSGSAYVFIRTGTTWTQQQKLFASDGAAADWFGWRVSLSGDTALFGVRWDEDNGNNSGSAYVFTKKSINEPPVFGISTPVNGSTNNSLSLTWNIPINDPEGDVFSWTIQCSNGQINSRTGVSNGTKSLVLSGLLYSTTYKVWVNATDPTGSGRYTRRWFTFTTKMNNPPVFGKPSPVNGSTGNLLSLSWSIRINDPEGNIFTWTIQCSNGQASSGTGASNGTKSLLLSGLVYSKTYKVWVNATDPVLTGGSGKYTCGWYTFNTTTPVNRPPDPPTITGPASGKVGKVTDYVFTTTDPEGDQVSYYIDWGDGQISGVGPYASGAAQTVSHTWSTKGFYTIKAKAKDTGGHESEYGTLPVVMPITITPPFYQSLEKLFERYPYAFPILRRLIAN